MSLFEDLRHLRLLLKVKGRLKEASKMGKLKAVLFPIAAAVVTASVAQVTGACPALLSSMPAIVMAGVGAGVTYLMRKPLEKAGTKAIAAGAVSVILAGVVQQLNEICGPGFVDKIPALLTGGLWVGLGLWLKAPHEAKSPDYVTPPILKG